MSSMNGLLLYTAATPNGHKVAVFLEELKAAYSIKYDVRKLDMSASVQEQKSAWYTALNPNGRIPTLVDRSRPPQNEAQEGFAVFETAAILLYLAQHYDAAHVFSFSLTEAAGEYSEMLQWVFWAHGGVGPMSGQAVHFLRQAPEDIPYAKTRYREETERLYGVMERRLEGREWLVGGKYSVADINVVPWIRMHTFAGIESLDAWPHLEAWLERITARPAFQAGIKVPQAA